MKRTIRLSLPAFVLCILCLFAGAQDNIYTQYQNAPLYYNPALTGADPGIHTYSLSRLQWMISPLKMKSFDFSGDFGVRGIPGFGGVGIIISGNNCGGGAINEFRVGISISSRFEFSKNFAAQIGIKGSLFQKKVDWDDYVFADQLSGKYGNLYQFSFIPSESNKISVADFGAGVLLQYVSESGAFANVTGMAVDHIFTPDVSFLSSSSSPYPRKWVVHSDVRISTKECSTCGMTGAGFADPLLINPAFLYQSQGGLSTIQAGIDLVKFNFTLGIWYQYLVEYADVFSVKTGFRIPFSKELFMRLMYSIDLWDQNITDTPVMAHEFSLVFSFAPVRHHKEKSAQPDNNPVSK
jgi:type IX secretion system PorP/SprF family membrane protein